MCKFICFPLIFIYIQLFNKILLCPGILFTFLAYVWLEIQHFDKVSLVQYLILLQFGSLEMNSESGRRGFRQGRDCRCSFFSNFLFYPLYLLVGGKDGRRLWQFDSAENMIAARNLSGQSCAISVSEHCTSLFYLKFSCRLFIVVSEMYEICVTMIYKLIILKMGKAE